MFMINFIHAFFSNQLFKDVIFHPIFSKLNFSQIITAVKITEAVAGVEKSIAALAAINLVYLSKIRCHMVLYGVFKVLLWLSLIKLRSYVLSSFADHSSPPLPSS